MIPKTIHQIWIGPKVPPFKWMATWKEKNPSFEHCFWTEDMIDDFGLVNRDKYDILYKKGIYDGAVDVARVEIVARFGGVFMDADSICLESIEGASFMEKSFFAVFEYDRRIANGIIGASPSHPILLEYMKRIKEATVLEPPCYTIGGTMLTSCVEEYALLMAHYGKDCDFAILPTETFLPKWKRRAQINGKIYSRQMWGTTKNLYKEKS